MKNVVLGILSVLVIGCSGGSDKEFLLDTISETEDKIETCSGLETSDEIGQCLNEAMESLQSKWEKSSEKLEGLSEDDAREVAAAYTKLTMTTQQQMMKIMMKNFNFPDMN